MAEIIRRAREEDIKTLQSLWNECFPNDTEYAEFFFDNIFRLSSAVVFEADGECVGMIHVFPRVLRTPEGDIGAKYIYGVGTSKKMRGRGIAGRLLASEENGCDVLLLIPQNDGLFSFYEKCGFHEIAKVSEEIVSPKGKTELSDAGEKDIPYLNSVYETELSDHVFAKRDEATWRLLMAEYEFLGGGFKVFNGGYCAYYEHDGKLYIAEFFSHGADVCEVAGAFGRECMVVSKGDSSRIAVMKPVSEKGLMVLDGTKSRYINLMHN